MKRRSLLPLRTFLAATASFGIACLVARLVVGGLVNSAPAPAAAAAQASPVVPALTSLPAAGAYAAVSPTDRVALSQSLCRLDPKRRDEWLAEAMQRDEPERSALLKLLLLGWAETDPAAAADWALGELTDISRFRCFSDIAESWGARDALALAHWWAATAANQPPVWERRTVPENTASMGPLLQYAVEKVLRRNDPLAFARFQEMDCCRRITVPGVFVDNFLGRRLSTLQQIADMAAAVQGHVAYVSDPEELRDGLTRNFPTRHADKKIIWNSIFEQTAVAWHRRDPAACGAWLQTFPENAQTAARHFIREDETTRARAPQPSPPEAPAASPAPTPVPPGQRLTSDAPVPGPAGDAARKDWSEWWRTDAAAAEAFLNASAWPDDMKFHARARAYASPP